MIKLLTVAIALASTSAVADGFPKGGKFLNLHNQYIQTDTGKVVRHVPKVLVYQLPDGSIAHLKRGEAFPAWRLKQIELQSWVDDNQDRRRKLAIQEHNASLDVRKDRLTARKVRLEDRIEKRKAKGKRTRNQERKLRRVERKLFKLNFKYL